MTLKALHMALALLSFGGLLARYALLPGPARRAARPLARALPHLVDTVLLASGIALALMAGWHPAHAPWFAAKLAAVLVYIVAGGLALRGPQRWQRLALVTAALAFGYVALTAVTKDPLALTRGPA